jgi:hypothetical protein
MKKNWSDYLWIASLLYLTLGFFNILFAWLGLLCFFIPLLIAAFKGTKGYCNRYCGRGQLFGVCGKCSRQANPPKWLASKWFRYGFLAFFLTMFGSILFQTWLVASGANDLREAIKLLWTFRIPWGWTYTAGTVPDWIAQFAFGFYSLMLTSTLIGFLVNLLFKPRAWCSFCPMGTMTQAICKIKAKEKL